MCIKSEFKEICLKLATNSQSDKGFLLTSKVCPQRVFCPCPGAIYMYKIIKNVYKIRFWRDHLKLALYGQREKAFLLSSKFCPQGVAYPCPGAIYMYVYKSIKIYTRTRCQMSVYRTTGRLVLCLCGNKFCIYSLEYFPILPAPPRRFLVIFLVASQINIIVDIRKEMSQLMTLWYLSQWRPAKAQASLCICERKVPKSHELAQMISIQFLF